MEVIQLILIHAFNEPMDSHQTLIRQAELFNEVMVKSIPLKNEMMVIPTV